MYYKISSIFINKHFIKDYLKLFNIVKDIVKDISH